MSHRVWRCDALCRLGRRAVTLLAVAAIGAGCSGAGRMALPVSAPPEGPSPVPSRDVAAAEASPTLTEARPSPTADAETDCARSQLGTILFTERTSGASTSPAVEALAQQGYTGLVGTPTYGEAAAYFPRLPGWRRVLVCNSHSCLSARAERAAREGLAYEFLGYGPERLEGVPAAEQSDLPAATRGAREIADRWQKRLLISYGTRQLHQEAEERGGDWRDPSAIVARLAPYGDVWLIQAADEYWRPDDGAERPILSQRHYPPGPEFRAEVRRWVGWIRAANPEIEVWVQLGVQRIGVEGATRPDAELVLEYRRWIEDLVDGIYITPIYGSIAQMPDATSAMTEVFRRACGGQLSPPATPEPTGGASDAVAAAVDEVAISLVEEGWTDDLRVPCPPNGECLTILPGYYYRIYENAAFPCGAEGYHQFMVLDDRAEMTVPKHLIAKFLGGAVGFWYPDETGDNVYYPNERATGILRESQNRNMFFRSGVSAEFAGGLTRAFREDATMRMVIVSYCSHDLYHGAGEYDAVDGFQRWGYRAAMQAVDYVQEHYSTRMTVTYGGSAGAAGAFYVGKDQDGVAGIIMDSQAVDLSAIRDACDAGYNVFGNAYPCYCPEGGPTCMEVLAPRIGFTLGADEPYRYVEQGIDTPIYYLWNEHDASVNAHLQFDRLHRAIETYNPGGVSAANMTCIADPALPAGRTCNLHVPSGADHADAAPLVQEIYRWTLDRLADGASVAAPASRASQQPTEAGQPDCAQSGFGTLLLEQRGGDRVSPFEVLYDAHTRYGLKGMVAVGAPSAQVRDEWFGKLDGWTRVVLRGAYAALERVPEAAGRASMADLYECLGYAPESMHQAGEEALDPRSWVPRAERLAEEAGKCLVYGPAVRDYERLSTPTGEARPREDRLAELIGEVAPHVDVWMIQLADYQRWLDGGRDDLGNPYTPADLQTAIGWWVAQIERANPDAKVWVQLGVGEVDPLRKACLPPQGVDYVLDYRAILTAAGVDGLWVMPAMPCQLSQDPQDHEYYLRDLEMLGEAIAAACGPTPSTGRPDAP